MIEFFTPGLARPKGSSRMIRTPHGHRVVEGSKYEKPWRAVVTSKATEAMNGAPPLEGPVIVEMAFLFPRPKAHYTSKGLRPNAPEYHTSKPDASKLVRSVEDAMNAIVFKDDSAIAVVLATKRYTEGTPGVRVRVAALDGEQVTVSSATTRTPPQLRLVE